jgi:hypothetical protein
MDLVQQSVSNFRLYGAYRWEPVSHSATVLKVLQSSVAELREETSLTVSYRTNFIVQVRRFHV